ncbi:MAG TPA: ATP-binding cassette domain-containing protein, partial [Usitatibacter sp.]
MSAALAVRDLRKSFGGLPAADGVTLEVGEGERHLIIGPNGAGKTTLFNLISGDLRPDSGSVRLFGEEVAGLRPDQRARRGMARTYQILTLFPHDTLAHNIVLSLLGMSPSRWRMLAPLAGMGELHDR